MITETLTGNYALRRGGGKYEYLILTAEVRVTGYSEVLEKEVDYIIWRCAEDTEVPPSLPIHEYK